MLSKVIFCTHLNKIAFSHTIDNISNSEFSDPLIKYFNSKNPPPDEKTLQKLEFNLSGQGDITSSGIFNLQIPSNEFRLFSSPLRLGILEFISGSNLKISTFKFSLNMITNSKEISTNNQIIKNSLLIKYFEDDRFRLYIASKTTIFPQKYSVHKIFGNSNILEETEEMPH